MIASDTAQDDASVTIPASVWWSAIVVGILAVLVASLRLLAPFAQYDGGISASAATFTLHGLLPYRDYWLLYGPLSGWLLAIPTALLGPSLDLSRAVSLVFVLIETAIVYRLARRWTFGFSAGLIAILAVVLPVAFVGIEFTAWPLAMSLALGALLLSASSRTAVAAGVLIGLAAMARLDVGGYALIACLLASTDRRRLLGGFACVGVPFALFLLVTTPVPDLVEQLLWYPTLGLRTFRSFPGVELELPPGQSLVVVLPLVLLPRILIVLSVVRLVMTRPVDRSLLALAAFAILCQAQTLGRADMHHYAQAATPALLLLAPLVGGWRLRSAVVLAVPVALVGIVVWLGLAMGYLDGLRDERQADLGRAVAIVRAATAPDEPIFVGLTEHRYTFLNAMVAYYLADRRPGTTQTLFDPGVTNRDETQARMIDELRRSGTRIMLLDTHYARMSERYNDSRIPGSTRLDAFIDAEFTPMCTVGDYVVMAKPDAQGAIPSCPPSPSAP